jgi:hypothetical protein
MKRAVLAILVGLIGVMISTGHGTIGQEKSVRLHLAAGPLPTPSNAIRESLRRPLRLPTVQLVGFGMARISHSLFYFEPPF